jgi:glycosyltransferase involved in cell wall biosynthesis
LPLSISDFLLYFKTNIYFINIISNSQFWEIRCYSGKCAWLKPYCSVSCIVLHYNYPLNRSPFWKIYKKQLATTSYDITIYLKPNECGNVIVVLSCHLKANVIYTDLSPCGGAERLTLLTMHALCQKGVKFDLTTSVKPNMIKLENAYGNNIASIVNKLEKVNILESLDEPVINKIIEKGNYDITINTHGDTLPYYHCSLSKNNAITYCHFPSAKYHIDSENLEYLRDIKISGFTQIPDIDYSKNKEANIFDVETEHKVKKYFKFLRNKYYNMMKNTLVLTNSEYTRKAISNAFNIDAKILYPPVDVETFQKIASKSNHQREDIILVISRIAPDKQIENAIEVARLIRRRGIGKGMIIAGNLHDYDNRYYQQLKKMIDDYGLSDFVRLQTNISFSKLVELLQLAKVYFHPRIDEHFGISIVEAMASGLVPIVSDIGGHTEFVPPKYHFHTLGHAADLIALAFEEKNSERRALSDSTTKFSNSNYVLSLHCIISELLNTDIANTQIS